MRRLGLFVYGTAAMTLLCAVAAAAVNVPLAEVWPLTVPWSLIVGALLAAAPPVDGRYL